MTQTVIANPESWKESIFGCCSDPATCCYGCFCPCFLFGDNVKNTTKEDGCCAGCCGYCLFYPGCCCLVHKPFRRRFRESYGLVEDSGCGGDFCGTWCCSRCAICQEAREIKTRGPPAMITIVNHPGPSVIGIQPASSIH